MKIPPLQFRREDIPDLSNGERTDKLLRGLNAFGSEAERVLNGGLTFKANVRAFAKDVTFTMAEDWTDLTITAAWTAAAVKPQVRKVGRRVELRGQVTRNAAASGSTLTTLAENYRPTREVRFATAADGAVANQVTVATDGTTASWYAGTPAFVCLDGCAWDTADASGGTNSAFPLRIKNEIGAPPSHAWVTRAVDLTNDREEAVACGGVAWSVSKDQIVIRDVANLLAGRKYRCTILVVAE